MKTLLLFSLILVFMAMPLIGQDWQVVKEGNFPYSPNDGFFINASIGWLVCNDGIVLKSEDGGVNGITITIPDADGIDLQDVEFANENIGFTCANDGYIYKTTDGGLNWTMIADTANFVADLNNLSIVTENLVFFAGKDSTLLKTEDGGTELFTDCLRVSGRGS